MTQDNLTPRDRDMANELEQLAETIYPDIAFQAELESKLKSAHKPKRGFAFPSFRSLLPAIGGALALAALAFALNWGIRNLAPIPPQPAGTGTSCPVTPPNGSLPPYETVESPEYLGNDSLWTVLWPNGRVIVTGQNREPDGAYSMKWGWWRAVQGPLTIEGRRLDAPSAPLRADIPDGYGDIGFQVSALIFPEPGCWEVTGRVGDVSLTFVTEVIVADTSTTDTDKDNTVRPVGKSYDWNGTTLFLDAPLPDLPAELPLYQFQSAPHATLESARALANQFGMSGQIYLVPLEVPGTADNDFLIVDGNQRLRVRSDSYFAYYPDYTRSNLSYNTEDYPDAESVIADFLVSKGFGTQFRIEPTGVAGTYVALPLLPNSYPIHYEFFSNAALTFRFDKHGLFSVDASLAPFAPTDGKNYRLITAEEALQKLLDPSTSAGYMVGQSSPSEPLRAWSRPRRENETVTVWGWMNSVPSADGGAPLVSLDGYSLIGNIADVPTEMPITFVEATGQFVSTNTGATVFNVESWKVYDGYEDGIFGALQREGGNVVIVADDGTYILPDVPADVPLPMENAFVTGVKRGDVFEWKTLDDRPSFGGGGGGGGGVGFYKLNLSGTPVPFPTASPALPLGGSEAGYPYVVVAGDTCQSIASNFIVDVESLIAINGLAADCSNLMIDQTIIIPFTTAMPPQEVNLRGILSVTIFESPGGEQRVQYGFLTMGPSDDFDIFYYYLLEGDGLEALQPYNGRPVDVWGTTLAMSSEGIVKIDVERFEIPFPDLQFEILRGTEETAELNGQTVLLFTDESGKQFVELGPNCYDIIGEETVSGSGRVGEAILLEALAVPGLTHGGYPAICVYASSLAVDPTSGAPIELTVSADRPSILPEQPSAEAGNIPTLTIEKVELVYFMPSQRYLLAPPLGPVYLQPVWRFFGRYSDGTIFEALIQALDPLFLLPEIEEPFLPG